MNQLSLFDTCPLSRRRFLTAAAAAATVPWRAQARPVEPADETTSFVLIGDTHYLGNEESPAELDIRSGPVNSRLIDTINRLPGSQIPKEAGGGSVATLKGVIHAGDLIDSGDKNGKLHEQMQQTEWRSFTADFGLTGTDGRLKFPIYEVHGNHDGPQGRGIVISGIQDRNERRPGVDHISPNRLHYAWNWGAVRCINLGIVVGQVKGVAQKRRYNPLDSLEFLIDDLRTHVGDGGRPIIITHHIDIPRYSVAPDPDDPANLTKEWNPCDVRGFYEALRGYNIAAILYGHTHARNVLKWDGTPSRAATDGLTLFNVDNSGHFMSDKQSLFYFEIDRTTLTAREYATTDRWQTGSWTPQVWRTPIRTT